MFLLISLSSDLSIAIICYKESTDLIFFSCNLEKFELVIEAGESHCTLSVAIYTQPLELDVQGQTKPDTLVTMLFLQKG